MKEINIKVNNISKKQWPLLLVELNLVSKNWRIYGPIIDIKAKNFDRIMSYLFVTPNMHKVHHHYKLPLTDSNYGNIFSVWDRIFGTYSYVDDSKSLVYGIDTHINDKKIDSFSDLLLIPFKKLKKTNQSKFS